MCFSIFTHLFRRLRYINNTFTLSVLKKTMVFYFWEAWALSFVFFVLRGHLTQSCHPQHAHACQKASGRTKSHMKHQVVTSALAQGLHTWPWRNSEMLSLLKENHSQTALFFLPALLSLHFESQSTALIVEYSFTHHWFLSSILAVTLLSASFSPLCLLFSTNLTFCFLYC